MKTNKSNFYKLAEKILSMKDDSSFNWYIHDGCAEVCMGTKKVWEFDCDLVIIACYGGGLEHIIWINEFLTVEKLHEDLLRAYINCKFVRFE